MTYAYGAEIGSQNDRETAYSSCADAVTLAGPVQTTGPCLSALYGLAPGYISNLLTMYASNCNLRFVSAARSAQQTGGLRQTGFLVVRTDSVERFAEIYKTIKCAV